MIGRDDGLDEDGAGQAPAGGLSSAGLAGEWGDLIGRSEPSSEPSSETWPGAGHPRRGSLRRPWRAEATVSAARDEALDPDAPDFGIRFARRFVAACRRGVIPRRRKRGLLRQQRGDMKWIRHAIRHLEREGKGLADGGGALSPPQRAVRDAIGIDRNPQQRGLVRRLLIAHGAEVAQVARVLRLDAAAVEAWQALFFDVRDRHQHPFRFVAALGDAPLVSSREVAARDLPPLWEFASMSLPEALLRCGLAGREGAVGILNEAVVSGEARRFESAARLVLMTPDRIDPESREVAKALAKYEAMEAKLRKEKVVSLYGSFIKPIESLRDSHPHEAGSRDKDADDADIPAGADFANMPEFKEAFQIIAELKAAEQAALPDQSGCAPLTAADLGRVRDLWRECQSLPAAQGGPLHPRKPPVLEPLWARSLRAAVPEDSWGRDGGEELLPEMAAPDFGWQLARTTAACGLQAKLPADEAFYWIRLAAEELDPSGKAAVGKDPCRRALQLAKDIHQRPLAGLLLRAALLNREAGIGGVAAFLALDPRVVAAYATLFFNVPGRGDEDAFKQQLAERYASDCDRLDAAAQRPGHGLAEPLRRAPELTLEQLERLLGFVPPFQDAHDAARMLLRCLAGLANGPGLQLDWDGGAQPRKPGRAARVVRNSTPFEEVVAAAGNMMEASHYGAAARFSGLGPLLNKQQRRANKASQYGVRLQLLIDSGLTRQEVEQMMQAEKEECRAEARRKMARQTSATHG